VYTSTAGPGGQGSLSGGGKLRVEVYETAGAFYVKLTVTGQPLDIGVGDSTMHLDADTTVEMVALKVPDKFDDQGRPVTEDRTAVKCTAGKATVGQTEIKPGQDAVFVENNQVNQSLAAQTEFDNYRPPRGRRGPPAFVPPVIHDVPQSPGGI